MGAWLSNISLKYKFWAVNAVAFVTTLLLVLYAVQLEQQARSHAAQASAQAQAQLLKAWPAGQALPKADQILTFKRGRRRASTISRCWRSVTTTAGTKSITCHCSAITR
ncbi:hypothetical protein V5O39_02550 [Pseudomonas parakoreensis]